MAGTLIMLVATEIAGLIITDITQSDYGILFSIWLNLLIVGGTVFDVSIGFDVEWYYSLASLCVVIACSLAVVVWQMIVKEGSR